MTIQRAMEIVLNLAELNVIDPERCDAELQAVALEQEQAIELVQSYDFQFDEE